VVLPVRSAQTVATDAHRVVSASGLEATGWTRSRLRSAESAPQTQPDHAAAAEAEVEEAGFFKGGLVAQANGNDNDLANAVRCSVNGAS
jgi:hypothetical protein